MLGKSSAFTSNKSPVSVRRSAQITTEHGWGWGRAKHRPLPRIAHLPQLQDGGHKGAPGAVAVQRGGGPGGQDTAADQPAPRRPGRSASPPFLPEPPPRAMTFTDWGGVQGLQRCPRWWRRPAWPASGPSGRCGSPRPGATSSPTASATPRSWTTCRAVRWAQHCGIRSVRNGLTNRQPQNPDCSLPFGSFTALCSWF